MADHTIRWAVAKRCIARLRVRTVGDAVTNDGDATVTSATAAFRTTDVGRPIAGVGIPLGATIQSVTNATTVELSDAATADGTGITLTIGRSGRRVGDGVTTSGSTTITSASAMFVDHDEGRSIAGVGIPDGCYIQSVTNATTVELSDAATADGTGIELRIGRGLDGVQVEPGFPGDTQQDESIWIDNIDGDLEIPVTQAGRKQRDDKFTIPFEVRVAGLGGIRDRIMSRLSEIVACIEDEFADDPGLQDFDGLIGGAAISREQLSAGEIRNTGFVGFAEVTVDCHARYV